MGRTVFSKIWDSHVLVEGDDGLSLLYVDCHLTHEVFSAPAFESLRTAGRKVRRPELTFGVMDHNVPTGDRTQPPSDRLSLIQMKTLAENANQIGFRLFDYLSPYQGIVHVIGPELGLTTPGTTIVCEDSHTSTHGALGAFAVGIGTSEAEHVFATQTLWLKKPKQMTVRIGGKMRQGVTAKDIVLFTIRKLGTGGALGHVVEFSGETVTSLSVEERMTLANNVVEAGARTAVISPDEKVYDYIREAPFAPQGAEWDEALDYWNTLKSDPDAEYDKELSVNVDNLEPQVTWGTNPAMTVGVTETVPSLSAFENERDKVAAERALEYMGLSPGTRITSIGVDVVFIGSCTNARLSDLMGAARVVKGKKVAKGVRALVVPGSQLVKRKAERLGLHRIFIATGFEWRNSGCSMCIAMNEDRLAPSQRSASTSNRNFENRQGPGGRTHLVSPLMAAAAAIEGHFVDVRNIDLVSIDEIMEAGAFA